MQGCKYKRDTQREMTERVRPGSGILGKDLMGTHWQELAGFLATTDQANTSHTPALLVTEHYSLNSIRQPLHQDRCPTPTLPGKKILLFSAIRKKKIYFYKVLPFSNVVNYRLVFKLFWHLAKPFGIVIQTVFASPVDCFLPMEI